MTMVRGRAAQTAFTLIELVAVLVIAGVLAVVTLPRFADVDVFARRGFFEEAMAATRYAQKLAVASGCSIGVNFVAGTNSFRISRWTGGANCSEPVGTPQLVAQPGSDSGFAASAPGGVSISNDLSFYFDRIGRPHALGGALITDPANLRVTIGGRRLQVTPDTGLVREN